MINQRNSINLQKENKKYTNIWIHKQQKRKVAAVKG